MLRKRGVVALGFLLASFVFTCSSFAADVSKLRIARPTERTQDIFSYNDAGTRGFEIWLREYKHPTVCPVYFCHGGCASGDLPCPSFLGTRVLDPQNNELLMSGGCCGGPAEMIAGEEKSMDCCK